LPWTQNSWLEVRNLTDINFVCERLRKFGFAERRTIRLYGEELYLISNPIPAGDGFAVEAIDRRSGNKKRVRFHYHSSPALSESSHYVRKLQSRSQHNT